MGRLLVILISLTVSASSWSRTGGDEVRSQDDPNNRIGLSNKPQAISAVDELYEGFGPYVTDNTTKEEEGAFKSASFQETGNTGTVRESGTRVEK